MEEPRLSLVSLALLLPLLLVLLNQNIDAHYRLHAKRNYAKSSCAGKPKDCKLPTRYLGETAGVACLTCEYRKTTQRVICTDDKKDKEAFRLKVRQSTPKKSK